MSAKKKEISEEVREKAEDNIKAAVTEKLDAKKIPKAWVTLLATNDFMPGLVACLASYSVVKKDIPIYVMVTPNISKENTDIIVALGGNIISVPDITIDGVEKTAYMNEHGAQSVHVCLPKLNLFRLNMFEKIAYVDADMLFMHNADEVFDFPAGTAVKDMNPYIDQFNAGFIVLEPSDEIYNKCMQVLATYENQDTFTVSDQDILWQVLSDWPQHEELHVPNGYNYMLPLITIADFSVLLSLFNVKLMHMMGLQKPWICPSKAYFEYNGGTVFAAAMEIYVKIINDTINLLAANNLHSEDLKPIILTEQRNVFGSVYPRE